MLSMLGLLVLGGAFVGLLSGLLGVGGAVIIMPLLNVFFDRLGFSVDTTQHLSLGTSLATILFTSLSSVLAHRRYGSVRADIWKKMAPGIIAGTLGGALLAPVVRDQDQPPPPERRIFGQVPGRRLLLPGR